MEEQTMVSKRKRQYLFTRSKIPRRTLYRLRKRALLMQDRNDDTHLPRSPPHTDNSESPDNSCATLSLNTLEVFHPIDHIISGSSSEELNTSHSESQSRSCNSNQDLSQESDCESENFNGESNSVSENSSINNSEESMGENVHETTVESDFFHQANISATGDCETDKDGDHAPSSASTLSPYTSCTAEDVYLMCLSIGARHNLSWVVLIDILKMINVCLGKQVIESTKYALFKYANTVTTNPTYHFYCHLCESDLGSIKKFQLCKMKGITCDCGHTYKSNELPKFFLSLDLKYQIKNLLERPEIANVAWTYRYESSENNGETLSDLYDGDVYKNLSSPGNILSTPLNFSLTFNTDGVSLGKSSSKSVWPIFAYINELPPQLRKQHMLLAGIWVDSKEPIMRLFLQPFVNQCQNLAEEGVNIKDPLSGEERNSKIIVICGVLDAVARYKVLNMSSFHAYYGCTQCYQRAEHTTSGRRYTVTNPPAPLRTNASIVEDMVEAYKNKDSKDVKQKVVKGVKGPSALMTLEYLNLSKSFCVDFMHSVLLGNIRYHTDLLLSSYGKEYYIGSPKSVELLNSRLMSIKPPKSITRTPRPIREWRLWKASEWRSWLLFYCIVCTYGLLKPKYIEHLAMLSTAIYGMLKKPILKGDLEYFRCLLGKYVFLMQTYFGKTAMVYNVHQLLHLVDGVCNWGPLFTHSAFDFEGENRQLMQMHTSPGNVCQQLSLRFQVYSHLPDLCKRMASSSQTVDFVENITGTRLQSVTKLCDVVLVGKGKAYELTMEERTSLRSELENPSKVKRFEKMFYKNVRFTSADYCVGKKNDDSIIYLEGGNYCKIESILCLESEALVSNITLFVRNLKLQRDPLVKTRNVNLGHIHRVTGLGSILAIQPKHIKGQCLCMTVDHGTFISVIPFGCYGD